jgi:hypothetical protein
VSVRSRSSVSREPHLRVDRVEAAAAGNRVDDDREGI